MESEGAVGSVSVAAVAEFEAISTTHAKNERSSWSYPENSGPRDLRIDFLRGLAVFALIINHIEIFSLFNLVTWERIGVVTGAEGFVILAGVVLGSIHRKRIAEKGWGASAATLIDRALQLYRVDLAVILAVALLSIIPHFDASGAMTFTDRGARMTYPLYPPRTMDWHTIIAKTLMLQYGPHQVQILGLYTVLLSVAPIVLWLFGKNRAALALSISWILYVKNWAFPAMPTDAQFEYGFPVLAWQLIFIHGLAFGYYRKEIAEWLTPARRTAGLVTCYLLFTGFMFFTLNNPYPSLPPWARLSRVTPETFLRLYSLYFQKNPLGILRLVNYLAVLVVSYHLLTICWTPLKRTLGWFFITFGQASLYVFILHIFVLLLIYNIPVFRGLIPDYRSGNFWLNTFGHALAVMTLWLLARFQVAFRWIPR